MKNPMKKSPWNFRSRPVAPPCTAPTVWAPTPCWIWWSSDARRRTPRRNWWSRTDAWLRGMGTPWFLQWFFPSENGWKLGGAPFQETSEKLGKNLKKQKKTWDITVLLWGRTGSSYENLGFCDAKWWNHGVFAIRHETGATMVEFTMWNDEHTWNDGKLRTQLGLNHENSGNERFMNLTMGHGWFKHETSGISARWGFGDQKW